MNNLTSFTPRASLATIGLQMSRMKIWQTVERNVDIKQKVIKYTPLEKLMDAFQNILAGGHGIVEVNTRLRPDDALQRAFGRKGCAEQSTISTTLSACTEENVNQMRQALKEIFMAHSQGYQHDYNRKWQVLDADITGMPAGQKGENVTKGYFSGKKGCRGRQLGRVTASQYNEVVVDRLYSGKKQLETCLQELVELAEQVMNLDRIKRQRTIIRVDGGGGRDDDINWLLERDYQIMAKVKNYQRTNKLHKSVETWYEDPKNNKRQVGWVKSPHSYERETRQVAIRNRTKEGKWQIRVLVFNMNDSTLFRLAHQLFPKKPTDLEIMLTALYAYDLRGGGVETSFKESKQGLGITKRNKRNFYAQEMLVLLAQLASNLIIWVRNQMVPHVPLWQKYGLRRMVRDVFQIPGKIIMDDQNRIIQITLQQSHCLASSFLSSISSSLARDDLLLNLGKI